MINKPEKVVLLGNVASMMLNFREHLIRDLVARGCKVYCLAQHYSKKDKQIIDSWGAVAVDSPLNAKGLNPFKDIVAIYRLYKIFLKIAPDVVFSCFVKPVIFGTLTAKVAKVSRIVGMIEGLGNAFTTHRTDVDVKTKLIRSIQVVLYKIALPKLDCLILLNKDDKRDLLDKYSIEVKQLEILGAIGLDLQRFSYSSAPTQNISFIFIARLLKEKGVFEYLEAAKRIKQCYPDTIFYILGGFDTENPFALKPVELDDFLKKGIVSYPGYVSNVPEWIAKSSVFVLPSYREGFPRSTQEAMAIGRPVITTDAVGCRETVKDGVNGFLVPLFDVHTLTEKMRFFIEEPEYINKMGKESRKMAEENFDVNNINKRLMTFLLVENQN